MRTAPALVLAVVVASCSPPDLESQLSITQGLYGQLRQRCQGADCVGTPLSGVPVGWFDGSPWATDGGVGPAPRQQVATTASGLYQLALESNTKGYVAVGQLEATVGVRWVSANQVTVPKGVGRVDWQGGPTNEGTWIQVR